MPDLPQLSESSESLFLHDLRSEHGETNNENTLLWWLATGKGRGREETPPAQFMMEALLPQPDVETLKDRLAYRIGRLITNYPDLGFSPFPLSEEAALQIFIVAAKLQKSDILAEPLWGVHSNIVAGKIRLASYIYSEFLTALIHNPQPESHQKARDFWFALLRGQTIPPFPPFSPRQGLYGLCLMTSDDPTRARVHPQILQQGLKLLKEYYERSDPENAEGQMKKTFTQLSEAGISLEEIQ